jgi:drug/metabolite transporter (DMT)-like permease
LLRERVVEARSAAYAPHVALFMVQVMFGTWPIFGKIALRAIPPTALVAFRVAGGAIAFLILQKLTRRAERNFTRKDYARLLLYSLLGVVLNQFLFVKGLSYTTVINATLLGTTIPVFTLLVCLFLGLDKISLRRIFGITLAAAGVIYLVDPLRASFSADTTLGNLLIVANSFSYGAYIAISKDILKRHGALVVITWIFIFGSFMTLPFGAWSVAQTGSLENAGALIWLTVLYIILVPTVGAYYLNAWALSRVAPSTVAVYIYLQPLIAFALAPLLLNEPLNGRTWIAALLIFAGVAIVSRRSRSYAMKEVAEHPDALGH